MQVSLTLPSKTHRLPVGFDTKVQQRRRRIKTSRGMLILSPTFLPQNARLILVFAGGQHVLVVTKYTVIPEGWGGGDDTKGNIAFVKRLRGRVTIWAIDFTAITWSNARAPEDKGRYKLDKLANGRWFHGNLPVPMCLQAVLPLSPGWSLRLGSWLCFLKFTRCSISVWNRPRPCHLRFQGTFGLESVTLMKRKDDRQADNMKTGDRNEWKVEMKESFGWLQRSNRHTSHRDIYDQWHQRSSYQSKIGRWFKVWMKKCSLDGKREQPTITQQHRRRERKVAHCELL